MPEFHLQLLTVFLNFFRCLPKGASRRGEDHFRLCNSSSDSVYSVVALSCLAGAQRTNREVCLQMLLLHQGKNSGWHVRGVVHVRHLPVVLMFFFDFRGMFVSTHTGNMESSAPSCNCSVLTC